MTTRHLCLVLFASAILAPDRDATALGGESGPASAGVAAEVIGVYVLPDTPLRSVEGFIANDRKIVLGGVGSDLWRGPEDPPNRFWMVSDRGPNGEVKIEGEKRRTFPVPDFSPVILHVELGQREIKILRAIPVVDSAGKPVGGLSNVEGRDEASYDHDGRKPLPYAPGGLDTEGLARTARGEFWLAEEYSPSLVRCSPDGEVLRRYVPAGLKLENAGYPVTACLPGILARREENRGFEGLTLSRDETTLYAVLQSPLSNPDKRAGEASRNVRLLAFDIARKKPVAQYVYRLEGPEGFGPGAEKPSDIKVSGLAMLDDTTMLVLERTDEAARLHKVDLAGATDVLGGKWDDESTSPSIEAIEDLPAAGVTALSKSLVVDLSRLPKIPGKIEGVAVIDARTIAVANDNDFDLGEFDSAGDHRGAGARSVICVVRLKSPLTLP